MLALSAIAGAVDCIGYLLLVEVFTSHISGDTVGGSVYAVLGDWSKAAPRAEAVATFFAGNVVGIWISDALLAHPARRVVAGVGALEVALLAAFVAFARPPSPWMVLWPATAMGVQNAMVRRAGYKELRTTFVTGMLSNTALACAELFKELFFGVHRGEAGRRFREFRVFGGTWLAFAAGGAIGAAADIRLGVASLFVPIAGLVALIVLDLIRPLERSGEP
ncbi:MAG TPA: YoaK family protein [Candidatus Acidoferrales bacterium]|nr:YoaK family protein [Candidatus Acidoferrales bacterium]